MVDEDTIKETKPWDAGQSTFASTFLTDAEKARPSQVASDGQGKPHHSLFGIPIDVSTTPLGVDEVIAAKAQVLNVALLDMGMGRYQWLLFLVTCMSWFLDYFWMASFIVIAPSASDEAQFFFANNKIDYLFISQFVGLTAGALVWPTMSDRMGRKWMFTSTLALMGMGGLVGAGMPDFTGLCILGTVVGLAIAGNQSIDAMMLLESVPASHQYLTTLQGSFWGLGELVGYAVGWAFIEEYTCGTGPDAESTSSQLHNQRRASSSSDLCHYVSNKGWRYVWWTFGCITLFLYLCRLAFAMHESPKYLLANRRDAEAVQTVKDISAFNKRPTWLTEASFARIDSSLDSTEHATKRSRPSPLSCLGVKGLAGLSLLWAIMGLTFPLHSTFIQSYLSTKGVAAVTAKTVTRDYLYSRRLYMSLCAIPGPLVVAVLIEIKAIGRKRGGAIIAVLTGLFMLLATVARSRNALLGFECILSFLHYAGLAILTTYTVEAVSASGRGAGLGITGFCWRLLGLVAWIIATYAADDVAGGAAVWFSGAMWIVMACVWLVCVGKETVGVAAL